MKKIGIVDVNECDSKPCLHGGSCTDSSHGIGMPKGHFRCYRTRRKIEIRILGRTGVTGCLKRVQFFKDGQSVSVDKQAEAMT